MASGDIYNVAVNCNSNNRAWSFGLHVIETTPANPEHDGGVVAAAVDQQIGDELRAVLSTDSKYEGVQAWRRFPTTSMPGFFKRVQSTGTTVGKTMSNDNSLYLDLRQSAGDAKFNGGIFLAGQVDENHTANDWDNAWIAGAVEALANVLQGSFNAATPDTGSWEFVVLSKAFSPPSTNVGTPLDVTAVIATTRVMTQRRRRQKSKGWSGP